MLTTLCTWIIIPTPTPPFSLAGHVFIDDDDDDDDDDDYDDEDDDYDDDGDDDDDDLERQLVRWAHWQQQLPTVTTQQHPP